MPTDFPEPWERAALGDLVQTVTSGATPTSGDARYYAENGLPFAKIDDLTASPDRFIDATALNITPAAMRESAVKEYPIGTLLLSMYGTIGLVKTTKIRLAANQAIAALLGPFGCNPDYLAHFLIWARSKWATAALQTTQANLNAAAVRAFSVSVPPLPEQRRIAEILDTLDEAIRKTEQLIEKLKLMKQGLLHDLLTRGIDEDAGRKCEFVNVLLADLVTPVREPGRPGLPVVSVTLDEGLVERDPTQRRVLSELRPEQHLLVRTGDIAYNMMRMWQGACGLAEADCLVSPAYVVLRMGERLLPKYAYLLFKSPELIAAFLRHSRGLTSDRYRLYPDELLEIQVSIPKSMNVQRRIVQVADSLGQHIAKNRQAVSKLRALKKGLMDDLLTGRVRVSVAEEEPA